MLLPMTIDVAPFKKAFLGDITLFWSFALSLVNLTPGVIISLLKLFYSFNFMWTTYYCIELTFAASFA